ncbi:MAG: hypothetical protein JJ920_08055 [Roseitalea sp.]|jgi:hypothetical protein|nr:hypothetical protein [Roseitalea sp.]MBO6721078.1 hypothetical protein [Roseitalea sp.]MBO6742850.1 hypothetical protein [Roseitalea sp.]
MTATMIGKPGLIAKNDDANFLRELIHDAAQRPVDVQVTDVCGAEQG